MELKKRATEAAPIQDLTGAKLLSLYDRNDT